MSHIGTGDLVRSCKTVDDGRGMCGGDLVRSQYDPGGLYTGDGGLCIR